MLVSRDVCIRSEQVRSAIDTADLNRARALVFHWLNDWANLLPHNPTLRDLRQPELWHALAAVVERTSDHYLIERFWQVLDRLPPEPYSSTDIPLLGVPILNRFDLLERLLDSLDYPVDTLAIVDNSIAPDGYPGIGSPLASRLDELSQLRHPLIRQIRIARPFCNIGVAASWNMILMSFPQAPFALLVNNDVVLAPGVLASAMQRINPSRAQLLTLIPDPNGFSAFLLTALCWDRLGLFDTSFHPAYFEDLDYRDRLRNDTSIDQLDGSFAHVAMAQLNNEHSATIDSDATLSHFNRTSYALNRLWYFSQRRLRQDPRGTWRRLWLAQWRDES